MINQIVVYAVYVLVSVALTIWVAKTLHKNGRVFLLGRAADSVARGCSIAVDAALGT